MLKLHTDIRFASVILMNKVRIAPTPSGYLHIGNVLSFALTVALAEREQANVLLRIDDMDQQRANAAYVQDIFDTLNFLELPWHEGPRNAQEFATEWSQMHRMPLYHEVLSSLQQKGQLFACNCSRSQIKALSADESYPGTCCHKALEFDKAEVNWRMQTSPSAQVSVNTWQLKEQTITLPASMQYFVVRKKDGHPAYQLSSVIDDLHFGITHIVRGVDLWASTLAQLYLAQALPADAFSNVQFYHHDLIAGADGQKLSKSSGATSVKYLREQGYKPGQVYQHIADSMQLRQPVANWQQLAEAFWSPKKVSVLLNS
ncbi:glutamate--tRNA ligase family protein [Mucilaginibacter sp. CSA2-8R]|uniref:glutamate--tRNA ligase family protein n=1 Tax=Mucilaginibacter sp. CSA2-8R TaxID=3141542 RepID=UPI00315C8793